MHQIQTFLATEAKIITLTRRLENLKLQRSPIMNQVSTPMCNGCSAPDHVLVECPLMNPIENGYAHVNATFQNPMNYPYVHIIQDGGIIPILIGGIKIIKEIVQT